MQIVQMHGPARLPALQGHADIVQLCHTLSWNTGQLQSTCKQAQFRHQISKEVNSYLLCQPFYVHGWSHISDTAGGYDNIQI